MTVNYKRFVRARISKTKFRQILRFFARDLNATQIAALTDLNRNTVNHYLTLIRQSIARYANTDRLSRAKSNSMNPTSARFI
jgi:transposase